MAGDSSGWNITFELSLSRYHSDKLSLNMYLDILTVNLHGCPLLEQVESVSVDSIVIPIVYVLA